MHIPNHGKKQYWHYEMKQVVVLITNRYQMNVIHSGSLKFLSNVFKMLKDDCVTGFTFCFFKW